MRNSLFFIVTFIKTRHTPLPHIAVRAARINQLAISYFIYSGALRRIPLVLQSSFFIYFGALHRIPLFIATNHLFAAVLFINHAVLFCSSTTYLSLKVSFI